MLAVRVSVICFCSDSGTCCTKCLFVTIQITNLVEMVALSQFCCSICLVWHRYNHSRWRLKWKYDFFCIFIFSGESGCNQGRGTQGWSGNAWDVNTNKCNNGCRSWKGLFRLFYSIYLVCSCDLSIMTMDRDN